MILCIKIEFSLPTVQVGNISTGQKMTSNQDHKKNTCRHDDHTHGCKIKQCKPFEIVFSQHTAHQEIGGGPDFGGQTPQEGTVCQGHHQARRCMTGLAGNIHNDG